MTPEQLELIKQTLKSVQPADGSWLPQAVQADIFKSINSINRELRLQGKEKDMGMSIDKKCSSSPYAVESSNPDPKNFQIIREKEYMGYLILLVRYPDCKNYEGRKLLVYNGFSTSEELLKRNNNELDPHFADTPGAPIARFRPHKESVKLIEAMIHAIAVSKKQKRNNPEAG